VATAVWCLLISIPSVGYGDKFPVTTVGRLIAAISFICGTFMLSILCNSMEIILKLSGLENKSLLVLRKLGVRKEIRNIAVYMFKYLARIAIRKR
jgi:Ion channel